MRLRLPALQRTDGAAGAGIRPPEFPNEVPS